MLWFYQFRLCLLIRGFLLILELEVREEQIYSLQIDE